MISKLVLQHFRSYSQKLLDFSPDLTVIIGPNTAGKTNLCEAIGLLSTGKSFRAQKDDEMVAFGQDVARVQGLISDSTQIELRDPEIQTIRQSDTQKDRVPSESHLNTVKLEVTLAQGMTPTGGLLKKYTVNDVPKSRNKFVGYLPSVLFRPEELEIISDGPSLRREFLNDVLEQVDGEYRISKTTYEKALRQRNALLDIAKDTGVRKADQFAYWDDILIEHGQVLTARRQAFIDYINASVRTIFDIEVVYDASLISRERLDQYKDAEVAAGNTLVGPQRDDFRVTMRYPVKASDVKQYASRGQQRLAVLQLKFLQLQYMEEKLHQKPLLILDDIFSELDSGHIHLVLEKVTGSQIILTTTHEEFVKSIERQAHVIKLNNL